jgi:hypothetical protein
MGFNLFKTKEPLANPLTLEALVDIGLITKEELLLIKKERATKEWEEERKALGLKAETRSHHRT